MSRKADWQRIWERFDPEEPVQDAAWRAPRPHSPIQPILRKLDLPFGRGALPMLLSGVTGSGKSTELLRVREARREQDFVIFLDLLKHFRAINDSDALQHVEAWEVVYQAGLAVLAAANEFLSPPVPDHLIEGLAKAWERAAEATGTPKPAEMDLGKIVSGMLTAGTVLLPLAGLAPDAALVAAAGTSALKAAADGVRRIVPIGRSKKVLPDQDEAMESVLDAVNLVIGYVQTKIRRIVLVIDGLDWIREEERQLALFDRSEMLGRLVCPALICAPYSLLSSLRARNLRRFGTFVLANEPVIDRTDHLKHGPGVAFFLDVYRRRTSDLGGAPLISKELLEKIAYLSGGRARDFTKLLRELAERAHADDVPEATVALVDEVIADARKLCERGLHAGHARVLREVMADPLRLPEDPLHTTLIAEARLLPFDNQTRWYYPHPLLWDRFLRDAGSTA